jgi:hypothetical protein
VRAFATTVVWFAVMVAGAIPLDAHARSSRVVTIRVRSVLATNHYTDVLPKGPSRGDVSRQSDVLINLRPQFGVAAGQVIGKDQAARNLEDALQAAVQAGDIAAVQELLAEQAAIASGKRVPEAWGGLFGWTSAAAGVGAVLC